jgi:hypothetical protein
MGVKHGILVLAETFSLFIYLFIYLFIQIHSINLTGLNHRYWNSPFQLYIVRQCASHKYNSTRIALISIYYSYTKLL